MEAGLQQDRKYCTKNLDTSLRSENNGDRLSVAVVYGRESVCKGHGGFRYEHTGAE